MVLPTVTAYPILTDPSLSRTSAFGNGTVNPVNDGGLDGPVLLDVGQHAAAINSKNAVLGTFLILLGLMQVFFGFKLIRITLFVTGFCSWAVAVMIIMVSLRWDITYLLLKPSKYYFWLWLLAGCLGAFLSFRFWDLGVTFAGGFGGFAVAMGIIAIFDTSLSSSNVGRYILLGIFVLFGAAIATFYERYSIILGTSFGGAYMCMYGVDEFLQVGYREMIVILRVVGKSLIYHPNTKVLIMIGCSLALACLGMAWEFWHHAKPIGIHQKALFRIYGRPFGKRPEKLMGQRIKEMDWFTYLTGCLCLRRKTAEEVLYEDMEDDSFVVVVGNVEATQPMTAAADDDAISVAAQGEKGQGDDEHPTRVGSLTVVHCESGISDMTLLQQQHRTESDIQSEKPVSLSGLSPVQVVIEEMDYEVVGDEEVVAIETFTGTVFRTEVESEAGTMIVSSEKSGSSMTRIEHHHHHSSTMTMATSTMVMSSSSTTTTTVSASQSMSSS
ncbi:MAG: hypothetical protein J3Q66DRAFT_374480 [Benniella sp.]|nr:MAG: hypothetical protein J3Q66DRAFT_374480 [Benniella sp.]